MSKALLKQSLAIVEGGMSDKKEPKAKKITIEDIRNERAAENKLLEENLQKLLTLSKPSARIRNSKNIIKRAHAGRYIIEKKKVKVEQESLFTEEDFAAFEKELAKTIT